MDEHEPPWELALPLTLEPRLASWNRRGDPDQLRLAAYLEHIQERAAPALAEHAGVPLALALTVGFASSFPLADPSRRDLDNYLDPVIRRLGQNRFDAVIGRKVHGSSSILVVPDAPDARPTLPVRLRGVGSYTLPGWKSSLEDALRELGVTALPDGEVHLDIRFTLGPNRNWVSLWKPTIDALTPLLGTIYPGSFNLSDGRITHLCLYRDVQPGIGHEVIIDLGWH